MRARTLPLLDTSAREGDRSEIAPKVSAIPLAVGARKIVTLEFEVL
jgi:hypothetical protein